MKVTTKVRVTRKSDAVLLGNIKALKNKPIVKVGFPAKTFGAYEKVGKSKPPTVPQVAVWNEFGTEEIPARPFLRTTFIKKRKALIALQRKSLKLVIQNKISVADALQIIGLKSSVWVQDNIAQGPWKENAESTKKKKSKKGKNPLIDTDLMRASVTYQVEMNGNT